MTELMLIVGFAGMALLWWLESNAPEEEAPLWIEHVHGPYVRTKYTALKGRDW